MSFTGTAVGVLALGVALLILWRHRWQGSRFTVALMLLGGFGIAGAGWVGNALASAGGWIAGFVENGTAQAFGVGVSAVILFIMGTWVVVDVKDRSIHPATPWVALTLPTALQVVGGIYIAGGDTALGAIGTALTSLAGWLGSL